MVKTKIAKVKTRWNKKWLISLMAIFLLVILGIIGLTIGYEYAYAQKFFLGVSVGNQKIGGQTWQQTADQFKATEDNLRQNGLKFNYGDREITVNPLVVSATDPDLAKPMLTFDWQKTLALAFAQGRQGNFWQQVFGQINLGLFGRQILPQYYLDKSEVIKTLQANFADLETPPLEAKLVIQDGFTEVQAEKSGYIFDYQQAATELAENLDRLNLKSITLNLIFQQPKIKKSEVGSAVNSLDKILQIKSLKLKYKDQTWEITQEQLIPWLEFGLVQDSKEVVLSLNRDQANKFLETIAQQVNVAGQDAKFELKDNRVVEFQASQDGQELKLEENYQKINNQIIQGQNADIELMVDVAPAKVATGDVNNLGIKELIGVGQSNFSGSPKNRRINIAVGANSLNGILIPPGEEFSLIKALGPVDGQHGYKQELVIKGDRTIPEYGGGLCQIGTTAFRVALNSGLPITARRNHSYRVVYYEPAGMDATIYDPSPDLRFINDTGTYILFTTHIEGDNLFFEFYGTKDGRQVVIDPNPPRIYNVTSPGAPHYIETEELKPGEKKKVESAHNGADTYFKYVVTYPNGEVKEKEFTSHYVPWPEVWLVGKQLIATSTDTILIDSSPVN